MRNSVFAAGAVAVLASALFYFQSEDPQASCPTGYNLTITADYAREFQPGLSKSQIAALNAQYGEQICLNSKHPEPMAEVLAVSGVLTQGVGAVPQGAYRAALAQKAKLAEAKADVAGSTGTWAEYGQGPLLDDPERGGLGLGIVTSMGRVDSFAYDEQNKRLFALIGTGGVWMSEADSVRELGDMWVPVGDNLPTLVNGAVEWTTAGGGRLIVVSGEHLMGGNTYSGLGAFWSDDLGQTWQQAEGVPDGALGFEVAVDRAQPEIVYVATSKGLFRSTDAGSSFVNVNLPTSPECAGVTDFGPCQFANFMTDVVVKEPGGSTDEAGGEVLAAVGYRAGRATFPDGTVHSPGNGLYRSASGEVDTFARLDVSGDGLSNFGFATEERIGRTELGIAYGPGQDHNYVYAIVEDAVLFNGGVPVLDIPDGLDPKPGLPLYPTSLNGLYVSPDFGDTWLRLADDTEIAANPLSGSSFVALAAINAPGVQAWYNLWIQPDPTRQDAQGVPTRLSFGLEEVWQSRTTDLIGQNGVAQIGTNDYNVIGTYYAGDSCQAVSLGLPICPTTYPPTTETTTHPDQHDGIYVPTEDGGVCLFAGNDGGVYRQCVGAGEEMNNAGWGDGANQGFNTLLPYGLAVARDGRVWFGLQDNGSGYVDGQTREHIQNLGGDGFFASVDPDNSDYAWVTIQNGALNVTTNGGLSYASANPPISSPSFANYFVMDPTDAQHVMTAGPEVVAVTDGPGLNWTEVFNLGSNARTGKTNIMSNIHLYDGQAYVGFCGPCDLINNWDTGIQNGIATNVGGDAAPVKGGSDGWHFAAAEGLPNRFISSIEMDEADPNTIYVALAGYANRTWIPPGSYLDPNQELGEGSVFVSYDAGESFSDITGNLPNVHARWILKRGQQLIVATDIGAFISSDLEGSNWAPLGEGLPNSPMTMMQLKPGDPNTLFVSTFGRGFWTYDFPEDALQEPELPQEPQEPGVDAPTSRGGSLGWLVLLLACVGATSRRRRMA